MEESPVHSVPRTGNVCSANSRSTLPVAMLTIWTLPLEAPMAQIGTNWFQFLRVSGGHIRRTKGGRARPDKIPEVETLTPGGSTFSKLETGFLKSPQIKSD